MVRSCSRARARNSAPSTPVILDVLMPGVDGAEFLARAREQLRTIPVLLFSASHLPRQLREDPQVKDLIPKPVEVEVLLEKIRAHCG